MTLVTQYSILFQIEVDSLEFLMEIVLFQLSKTDSK